jgi:TonB-dependent SusC/RagA subfamily outer membrane receptor
MVRHYILVTLVTCLILSSATAQDLIDSRRSSYSTFIYKITNDQAGNLYHDLWDVDTTYFKTPIDFFPTDSIYNKKLAIGHYLFVHSVSGRLICELKSIDNIEINILNNHRDLVAVFSDSTGNEVSDAKVKVKNKSVPFEKSIRAYRLAKTNKQGIISVMHHGHSSFFEIERQYNNTYFVRTGKRIVKTFPVNILISPFVYIYTSIRNLVNDGRLYPPKIYYWTKNLFQPKPHQGYIVFNKPTFKPADTVRLKGFITNKKGKAINKLVDVYILNYYRDHYEKKIMSIEPFTKGGYQAEFRITDSLKLKLDENYTVEFRSKKGRRIFSSGFRYEDYELKQNNFTVRSENKQDGSPAILYLKGVDSNEMPLYDIRAEILLKPTRIKELYTPAVFVADTLWFHQIKLDPLGETKILLPDSIMPDISMEYEAVVSFLNSENERIQKTTSLNFDKRIFPVFMELRKDSLVVGAVQNKQSFAQQLKLDSYDADGIVFSKMISIPHKEKISSFTAAYALNYQNKKNSINLSDEPDLVQVFASRKMDSLFISMENPRRLIARYFLFKNKALIEQSQTESLLIKKRVDQDDDYTLSVQYVWGGRSQTREYVVGFDEKNLDIKITHPPLVYPGQKTNFDITVRDIEGKPVANTDLTAFAITKKFQNVSETHVPSFSKSKQRRAIFNEFHIKDSQSEISKFLEFSFWKKTLGLDSMTFYQFLFPESGYFESRSVSTTTEFAPFVVAYRDVLPVHVIYLDGKPVYFRNVGTIEPYSFPVTPGKHKVELRLSNSLITITGVQFNGSEKLIFSINREHLPANTTYQEMPNQLSADEQTRLSRYFMVINSAGPNVNAFVQQGSRFHLIGQKNDYYENRQLIGPLTVEKSLYSQKDGFNVSFDYEPFYRYEFKENLIKMHEIKTQNYLSGNLNSILTISPSFKDHIQSLETIQRYWKKIDEETPSTFRRFPPFNKISKQSGRLTLERGSTDKMLKTTFIVNLDHPNDYSVFPGDIENSVFNTGHYQAVLIFGDESYIKADSIFVRENGINMYDLSRYKYYDADTFSNRVLTLIKTWSQSQTYIFKQRESEAERVKQLFYHESSASDNFDHTVIGRVGGEGDEIGVPGVSIIVKGYAVGTMTDSRGYYSVNCPSDATLIFSFVGYVTIEEAVKNRATINITMQEDIQQLSEVVVVGYGSQSRKALVGATALLSGRVAGVSVDNFFPGASDSIVVRVRGAAALSTSEQLVILDGVPVKMSDVNPNSITAIEILKGDAASAIYGSRAANGVILLSTKPGSTKAYLMEMGKKSLLPPLIVQNVEGSSLRKNFRDYAFWKPALKTDDEGKASFEATFPDDITGWNAYVLAMASKGRTGKVSSTILSYKPLIAQLAQPNFLIEGDLAIALGKITNYGQDKIQLERKITINDKLVNTESIEVVNSRIDSIHLNPSSTDSIRINYSVNYQNYTDGELRKLPVYRKGINEFSGSFISLDNDTTVSIEFPKGGGDVTLYAQADLLEVFIDEINLLKNYAYECNEQLASKLRALLLEKQIQQFRNQKFSGDREAEKIIKKLIATQNKDGSWSWWKDGDGEVWITLHTARALLAAQKLGYSIPFNKQEVISFLEGELTGPSMGKKLEIYTYLLEQGESIKADIITDSLRKSTTASIRERLLAERVVQLSGQKPDLSWINSKRSNTIKGNYYWGEERTNLDDNAVQNTLIVYTMLQKENSSNPDLTKIRNYFLEKRRASWRNTYESSQIAEAIIPSLLTKRQGSNVVRLQLTGDLTRTVDTFPYEFHSSGLNNITLAKSGPSVVYFTAHQQNWISNPTASEKDFGILTNFENNKEKLDAGKPVKLNITVNVKQDAEYVMVEIPIPAGCSYDSKSQSHRSGEVHREYFNNKVNIYCKLLKKGTYTYTVDLLPRYSGTFTLNPAIVSCMYFPTLFGRQAMKTIQIK